MIKLSDDVSVDIDRTLCLEIEDNSGWGDSDQTYTYIEAKELGVLLNAIEYAIRKPVFPYKRYISRYPIRR